MSICNKGEGTAANSWACWNIHAPLPLAARLDYLRRDNLATGEITVSDFGVLFENMRVGEHGP